VVRLALLKAARAGLPITPALCCPWSAGSCGTGPDDRPGSGMPSASPPQPQPWDLACCLRSKRTEGPNSAGLARPLARPHLAVGTLAAVPRREGLTITAPSLRLRLCLLRRHRLALVAVIWHKGGEAGRIVPIALPGRCPGRALVALLPKKKPPRRFRRGGFQGPTAILKSITRMQPQHTAWLLAGQALPGPPCSGLGTSLG